MFHKRKINDYIGDFGLYKIKDSLRTSLSKIAEEVGYCLYCIDGRVDAEYEIEVAMSEIKGRIKSIEMLLNDEIDDEEYYWEKETLPDAKKLRNKIISLTKEYDKKFRSWEE